MDSTNRRLLFDLDVSLLLTEEILALERLRDRSSDWEYRVCICDSREKGERHISEGTPVIGYETAGRRLPFHYLLTSFDGADEGYIELVYKRFFDIPFVILETDRCIVREIAMSDMDGLYKLYSYPGMTDHVEPLFERPDEEEYERRYITNIYDLFDYGMWMVCDKDTGEIIGRVGLEDKGRYDSDGLSLGYMIRTDMQRRGLGREVCEAVLGYAISKGEKKFYCEIDEGHTPSIELAKSLGFVQRGPELWGLVTA